MQIDPRFSYTTRIVCEVSIDVQDNDKLLPFIGNSDLCY